MKKTNRYTAVPVLLLSGLLAMALPEEATAVESGGFQSVNQGFTVFVGETFRQKLAAAWWWAGTDQPFARVLWGDSSILSAVEVGPCTAPVLVFAGACDFFGTHVYQTPGVYVVRVIRSDSDLEARFSIQVLEPPGPVSDPLDQFVLVSVGDSVASGEGSPNLVTPNNLAFPDGFPLWDDGVGPLISGEIPLGYIKSECHRSERAHAIRLVERLQAENPGTTFKTIHLACSGAETAGVAGQIAEIRNATIRGTTNEKLGPVERVDALLMSVGANDSVGGYDNSFGGSVTSCLGPGDCSQDVTLRTGLNVKFLEMLNTPTGPFSTVNNAIRAIDRRVTETGRPIGQTYITEYYNPTRNEYGQFGEFLGNVGCTADLITGGEWAFLERHEVEPLNASVANAASAFEWIPVKGIAARFVNHGYCAGTSRWVVGFDEALTGQHDKSGTAHPNKTGQWVIADQIYQEMLRSQPPRTTAEISHMPNVWTNQDVVVKLTARNLRGAGADELSWTLRRALSGVVAQDSVQAQETTGATSANFDDWLTGRVRPPFAVSTLQSNRALFPTGLTPLWSDDGRFRLIYQPDGNVVLYWGDEALWATNTMGSGRDGQLAMQNDGNLVLYDSTYRNPVWESNTDGHPGAYLTLQDDGNLVIYEPGDPPRALWATGTYRRRTTLSHELTLSDDGQYQLEFSSANAHGVWEKPVFIDNILIDKTPPTTSWTISPSDENGWHRTDVSVTLIGEDSGIGAMALSYELRGAGAPGGPVNYERRPASASVTIAQEGITTLAYFSTDHLGNRENERTITIRIDRTPPTIALTSPPPAANAAGWHREDVPATWSCADGLSGVTQSTVTKLLSSEGANQSLEGTCVDAAGNTASHAVTGLNLDKTPPTIGLSSGVKPAAPGTVWYREDVTAIWSCIDHLSGPTATTVSKTLSTEGMNQSLQATCSDRAGNAASHTVLGLNLDKTPPELTFDVPAPAPNEHGWHNGDVAVGWSCSDALSGRGVGPFASGEVSVSGEGAGQLASATCIDPAGNATTSTAGPINIDRTPPLIALDSRLPAPNAAGWNQSDVTATWSCADGVSGPAAPSVSKTLSAEGVNQSLAGTCVDRAGNAASHTVAGLNLDKTPPAIAFVNRTPAANQHGWASQDITATWACHDALSGPTSESVSQTLATEGRDQFLTGNCDDLAGNQGSHTVTGLSLDKTPPSVVFGERSPAANAAGWNNTAVALPFTAVDNLSGVASTSIPSPLWFASEGAALTASVDATDLAGNKATFVSPVVRIDLTPPTIACNATPATIWPPNYKMVPVSITVPVTDVLSGRGDFILNSIGVNEPAAPSDVAGFVIGTASTTGQLRATRAGGGSGRIYSLEYSGRDAAGNQATCASQILVPHDQGKD